MSFAAIYERIMDNLRAAVASVEENELFEQTILRGSLVGLARQSTSNNIDTLMQSMMPRSMTGNAPVISNGPWNRSATTNKNANSDVEGNRSATEKLRSQMAM